jgi:molybdopterin synthase catalytic subunit
VSVRVQSEDFDAGAEAKALVRGRPDIGAVVTFTGIVRGTADGPGDGGAITSMTLEHYPGMTEAEMSRVEAQARTRWPLAASLVIHRTGELKPGDNIVLVITASAHRGAAFEAAEFLIDYLKTRAPFWKKETGPGGAGGWVEGRESDEGAARRWTDRGKVAG